MGKMKKDTADYSPFLSIFKHLYFYLLLFLN